MPFRKNARGLSTLLKRKEGKKERSSHSHRVRYSRKFLTNFSFARARLKNAFSPATRGLIHLESPLSHWNTHSSGRKYGRGEERQVCVDARGTFSSPFFFVSFKANNRRALEIFFFLTSFCESFVRSFSIARSEFCRASFIFVRFKHFGVIFLRAI